jgi:hypothetical protein
VELSIDQRFIVRADRGPKKPAPKRAALLPSGSKDHRMICGHVIDLLNGQSNYGFRHCGCHTKDQTRLPGHRAPETPRFNEYFAKERRGHLLGEERECVQVQWLLHGIFSRAPPIRSIEIQAHEQYRASRGTLADSCGNLSPKLMEYFRRWTPNHRRTWVN